MIDVIVRNVVNIHDSIEVVLVLNFSFGLLCR